MITIILYICSNPQMLPSAHDLDCVLMGCGFIQRPLHTLQYRANMYISIINYSDSITTYREALTLEFQNVALLSYYHIITYYKTDLLPSFFCLRQLAVPRPRRMVIII